MEELAVLFYHSINDHFDDDADNAVGQYHSGDGSMISYHEYATMSMQLKLQLLQLS
jgi:hypothetical protein